jgi:hypothetical protein
MKEAMMRLHMPFTHLDLPYYSAASPESDVVAGRQSPCYEMMPPHPYAQLHPGDAAAVTAGLWLHVLRWGPRLIETKLEWDNDYAI